MSDSTEAEFYKLAQFDSEAEAHMAARFFNDFHLWSDYKGEVRQLEVKDFYDKSELKWCCLLPEHVKQYSTTLERMSCGLSDFMMGYRIAQRDLGAQMDARLAECTADMVGEPLDGTSDSPKYWVERVTKAGKITLSPKRLESKCRSCGYDTRPGSRYCGYCR